MKWPVYIIFVVFTSITAWGEGSFEKGNKAYLDAKYDEALSFFEESLNEDPNNISALYNLGMTQIQLKNFGEAIWAFESVLKRNPGDSQAEEQLLYVYTELGAVNEWQHMLGPFEKALFSISSGTWATFSIILSLLGSGILILSLIQKKILQRKYVILFSSAFFSLMIITGFVAYKAQLFETVDEYAIVTSNTINSYLSEDLASEGPELIIGHRLKILSQDTVAKILEVQDVNNNVYFVHDKDVKSI